MYKLRTVYSCHRLWPVCQGLLSILMDSQVFAICYCYPTAYRAASRGEIRLGTIRPASDNPYFDFKATYVEILGTCLAIQLHCFPPGLTP
ncbi:hypothetical protein F5Y13DRAFT_159619 [Hypoxylon sp. FL1857]|nr:hypothetical protein F5Y13DRAFT_159619 [Hypoxylon sp. FL1857]